MPVNRGLVFWGVALVTAGAVALAVQSDLIAEEVLREAWRLWPVVLIVIGLAVIAARTPFAILTTLAAGIVAGGLAGALVGGIPEGIGLGCDGEVSRRTSSDGTLADGGAVELDFNCGDLAVALAPGEAWRVDAGHAPGAEPTIDGNGRELRVEADGGGFMGLADARQNWEVTLPADVELELDVAANAAASRLDLAGGTFEALRVDMNAGDVRIDLAEAEAAAADIGANAGSVAILVDGDTGLTGRISVNAGSVELCATDDSTLAITISDPNVTFSHNLEASDLERSGDTWANADDAAVVLNVDGNAASFTLNPNGGCS